MTKSLFKLIINYCSSIIEKGRRLKKYASPGFTVFIFLLFFVPPAATAQFPCPASGTRDELWALRDNNDIYAIYNVEAGAGTNTLKTSVSGSPLGDIAFGPDGNLYGITNTSPSDLVLIDTSSGATTHLATITGFDNANGLALDGFGNVYMTNNSNTVYKTTLTAPPGFTVYATLPAGHSAIGGLVVMSNSIFVWTNDGTSNRMVELVQQVANRNVLQEWVISTNALAFTGLSALHGGRVYATEGDNLREVQLHAEHENGGGTAQRTSAPRFTGTPMTGTTFTGLTSKDDPFSSKGCQFSPSITSTTCLSENNSLWVIASDGKLVRIKDPAGAHTETLICTVAGSNAKGDIGLGPDNALYALDFASDINADGFYYGDISRVDTITGAITVIGRTALGDPNSLSFDKYGYGYYGSGSGANYLRIYRFPLTAPNKHELWHVLQDTANTAGDFFFRGDTAYASIVDRGPTTPAVNRLIKLIIDPATHAVLSGSYSGRLMNYTYGLAFTNNILFGAGSDTLSRIDIPVASTAATPIATPVYVYFPTIGSVYGATAPNEALEGRICSAVIQGKVFHDANGLTDGIVNGSGLNPGGLNVVLTDNVTGNVLAAVAANSDGSFSFGSMPNNDYSILITTNTATVGSPPPAIVLPAGWVMTGEHNGAGPGSDGTANALLSLGILYDDVAASFGVEQLPAVNASTTPIAQPVVGQLITLDGIGPNPPPPNGTDAEDGPLSSGTSTIVITQLPTNSNLLYNGVTVTAGEAIPNFNPSLLQVQLIPATVGSSNTSFQFNYRDAAGVEAAVAATYSITWGRPLPIMLASFNVVAENNKTRLDWSTSSESNCKGFGIERSIDAINWTTLEFVNSKAQGGNSNTSINYTTYDNHPFGSINYYRLKQTTKDEQFRYSETRKAVFKNSDAVIVYPNPVGNEMLWIKTGDPNNITAIRLLDMRGKTVYQAKNAVHYIDVSNLPRGIYILETETGRSLHHTRVFKK